MGRNMSYVRNYLRTLVVLPLIVLLVATKGKPLWVAKLLYKLEKHIQI
jgi:hypothetical protein